MIDRSERCIKFNRTYFEYLITFKDNIMCVFPKSAVIFKTEV